MISLYLLCALLLLFLLAAWIVLRLSVIRVPVKDISDPRILKLTHMGDAIPLVEAGKRWLEAQNPEDVWIFSRDGKRLHGLFLSHENARGTLIFFHGYRSSYAIDFAGAMDFYYDLGFNLLICEQRAHGLSQGRCLTLGVKERYDVQSWTNYVASVFGENHPVVLAGLSMGATTVLLASNLDHAVDLRCIIADCGFTSPLEICRHVSKNRMHLPERITVPFLALVTRLFCGFRLDECSTLDAVKETKFPIFFIHGTADDFVPCPMTEENYKACRSEKELLLVEGAGHGLSFVLQPEEYKSRITAFLARHI